MIYILLGMLGMVILICIYCNIGYTRYKKEIKRLGMENFDLKDEILMLNHRCKSYYNEISMLNHNFKKERLEDNKKFMELTSLYATLLHDSFEFNSKYNVGDKIAYSVNGKVRFGNVKNIIVEVAKSDEKIYQYELYLYLTKEGDRVYEEQIISKQ